MYLVIDQHLMTMTKSTLIVFLSLILLTACNRYDPKKLEGKWKEVGTGDSIYSFKNGEYTIEYGEDENNDNDKGTFTIEKNLILTQSKIDPSQESYRIKTLEENKLVLNQNDLFELNFVRIE